VSGFMLKYCNHYARSYLCICLIFFLYVDLINAQLYTLTDGFMNMTFPTQTISFQYYPLNFGPNFINNTDSYIFKGIAAVPNGPLSGCYPYPNTTAAKRSWNNAVVFIKRTACATGTKVKYAELAGAIAVVLVNCDPGPPSYCVDGRSAITALQSLYTFTSLNIPAANARYSDANGIFDILANDPYLIVNVSIPATGPLIDPTGTIQQGLVSLASNIITPTDHLTVGSQSTQSWAANPTDPCIDKKRPYQIFCLQGRVVTFDNAARSITGYIHPDINKITTLERFVLEGTPIGGTFPNMNNCTKLNTFDIKSSRFSNLFDSMFYFTNLRVFDVRSNLLISIPSDISVLQQIQIFAVSNNFLTSLPVLNSYSLITYDVSYNNISSQLQNFSGMAQLTTVNLAYNKFVTNNASSLFDNLINLVQIDLGNNQLQGPVPNFQNCPKLDSINLNYNNFSGIIPPSWNIPTKCSNNVTKLCSKDYQCDANAVCKSLTTILVAHNQLTGYFSFSKTSLVEIDLSYNLYNDFSSGTWTSVFKLLPATIKNIYLSHNMLTGSWSISGFKGLLNNIDTMDLSYNYIQGLPDDFWGLDVLPNVFRIIDISFNNLSGTIPAGQIKNNIEQVRLQGNPMLVASPPNLIPDWLIATSPYTIFEKQSFACPSLRAVSSTKMYLTVDPSYYGYEKCSCINNHIGQPPNCVCPVGTLTIFSNSSTTCKVCEIGTFSNKIGSLSCTLCPAGKFSGNEGSSVCSNCVGSSYAKSGASSCIECDFPLNNNTNCWYNTCPAGRYANTKSYTCDECPIGTYSSYASTSCEICQLNTFSAEVATANSCAACPKLDGILCADGKINVKAAYWVHITSSKQIQSLPCASDKVCVGGLFSSDSSVLCGANRKTSNNVLCGQCIDGYIEVEGQCVQCNEANGGYIILLLFLATLYVGVIHFLSRMPSEKASVTIFMYFIQSSLLILSPVTTYMSWIGFFNFNPDKSTGPVCIIPMSGLQIIGFNIATTFLFFAILGVISLLNVLLVKLYPLHFAFNAKHYKKTVISLVLYSYTQITSICIDYLNCTNVEDHGRYMFTIPSVSCDDSSYKTIYPLMIILLVLYTVGVPSVIFFVLFRNRNRLETKTDASFALLYKPFKLGCFFWQSWILMRRVAMACISAFLMNVKSTRALSTTMLNLLCLVLQMWLVPFKRNIDNSMESFSLLSLIILSSVQSYSSPPSYDSFTISISLIVVIIFVCVFIMSNISEMRRTKQLNKEHDINNQDNI